MIDFRKLASMLLGQLLLNLGYILLIGLALIGAGWWLTEILR